MTHDASTKSSPATGSPKAGRLVIGPGAILGAYHLKKLLGAGGMGEVWLARDTRLGRSVAIKILPPEFSSDARQRTRFEREAKAISSLSHPNICALHDIGHQDGVDYLVLEYLEGETLADVMKRGPLPLDRLLRYGTETAIALTVAHKRGIVHRDLKPSNVIITKWGAKLLDFGLAKSVAPVHTATLGATIEKPLTGEGHIVGTLGYMAPEQLEGRDADERTDIFALGNILYLMATGRRPFEGSSDAAVIAAILTQPPPPLQATQPPALGHIIEKCLSKNAEDRWQSVQDVHEQLEWLSRAYDVAPPTRKRFNLFRLIGAAVGVALIIASILFVRSGRVQNTVERFQLQPPPGLRVSGDRLAVSPDGRWIAFQGTSPERPVSLYLRSTSSLDVHPVAESAVNPFFSPDGKWLAFFVRGSLKKVMVPGGDAALICAGLSGAQGTWAEDGTILFSDRRSLWRVAAAGGTPEVVTVARSGEHHLWPRFLPGGKQALFVIRKGFSDSFRTIAVVSLEDRSIRALTSGTEPHYIAGHLVYSRHGTIQAAKFDASRLQVVGDTKAVLPGIHFNIGTGASAFDISDQGALIYIPEEVPAVSDTDIVWVNRSGAVESIVKRRGADVASSSPDGRLIAVTILATVDEGDIWIYDVERSNWRRLTVNKRVAGPLAWTPDAAFIIFSSFASGNGNLFRVRSDGSAAPEQLTSGFEWDALGFGVSVHPNDNLLIFFRQRFQSDALLTLSLQKPAAVTTFHRAPWASSPTFSPNGRWVAYESRETGQAEVHVRPYPRSEPRLTVSTDGGGSPFWSFDGRELFYRRQNQMWVASVSHEPFRVGKPHRLFPDKLLDENAWAYGVSRDGKRILMVRPSSPLSADPQIVYVRNWLSELEKR